MNVAISKYNSDIWLGCGLLRIIVYSGLIYFRGFLSNKSDFYGGQKNSKRIFNINIKNDHIKKM